MKLRGFRIELGEIEEVLRGANKAAVVTVAGQGSQQRLVAYVVDPEAGDENQSDQLETSTL